ncbi:MAG: magnetosome protein MamC [Magnetococcales bacterium]|nr:magnetosome protein MamC [Magnetococcales bacterium]
MSFNLAMFLSKSVGGVGVLGGVVGGSAALAKNISKVRKGEMTNRELAIDTGKETVGAGVATAFSAFTAGVVGGGLALSLGTAFVAAAAGKYAWDYGVEYVETQINKDFQGDLDDEMDEAFAASHDEKESEPQETMMIEGAKTDLPEPAKEEEKSS